jgi:hypothetical protein
MPYHLMQPRFQLGRLLATPGVLLLQLHLPQYLRRHHCGDWGDLGADDKEANERSLKDGSRLLSAYQTPKGKIWIITEADRSSTTVLLPDEY